MTQEQLEEKLAVWQKRLRLQDWHLIAQLVRKQDMKMDGNAEIALNRIRLRGQILILPPEEQMPSSMGFGRDSVKHLLAHELLHIFFNPFQTENDSPLGDAEEQAVERLAMAFVEMDDEIEALRAEVAALKGGGDG
jgi:hypothetical protein